MWHKPNRWLIQATFDPALDPPTDKRYTVYLYIKRPLSLLISCLVIKTVAHWPASWPGLIWSPLWGTSKTRRRSINRPESEAAQTASEVLTAMQNIWPPLEPEETAGLLARLLILWLVSWAGGCLCLPEHRTHTHTHASLYFYLCEDFNKHNTLPIFFNHSTPQPIPDPTPTIKTRF